GAAAPSLQRRAERAGDGIQHRLERLAIDLPLAEIPPRREQLLGGLLAGSPDRLRLAAAVDALAKIAVQVSPADLALFRRRAVVRPPAIAADDPRDRLAQQRLEPLPVPPRVDHEERRRGGRGRPEPPPGAGLLPARLVHVLGRGRADRLTGLVVG